MELSVGGYGVSLTLSKSARARFMAAWTSSSSTDRAISISPRRGRSVYDGRRGAGRQACGVLRLSYGCTCVLKLCTGEVYSAPEWMQPTRGAELWLGVTLGHAVLHGEGESNLEEPVITGRAHRQGM